MGQQYQALVEHLQDIQDLSMTGGITRLGSTNTDAPRRRSIPRAATRHHLTDAP